MFNYSTEDLVPLRDAAKLFPHKPSLTSLRRWARVGVRRVRLESLASGGRRYTSREAVVRFLAAINPSSSSETIRSEEIS
jgi:hypothetical protein